MNERREEGFEARPMGDEGAAFERASVPDLAGDTTTEPEELAPRSPKPIGLGGVALMMVLAGTVLGGTLWGIRQGQKSRQAEVAVAAQARVVAGSVSVPDTSGLSVGTVQEGRASLGEIAPPFTLETPEGGMVSLSDFAGQPVVLNFWATWCAPCRAEMPYLQSMHVKYADDGLVVLAVDVLEPTSLVAPFLEQYGLTMPVALDLNGSTAYDYRIGSYPTTYMIGRDGRVVNVRRGAFYNELDLQNHVSMIMPEVDDL
jgi:thiol-disulfide isomerase/thioredoxin